MLDNHTITKHWTMICNHLEGFKNFCDCFFLNMNSQILLQFGQVEDISYLDSKALQEINEGKLTILDLVEGLSSYLTSTDEEKRRQGVLLLANILKQLSPNFLNEKEVNVLLQFFCDRLKDRLTVIPAALKGLESIALMENISDNAPFDIIMALSTNLTASTLMQSSRLSYYAILKNLMYNKTKVLLNNSNDFVYAVISAMDSESDPRCLVYLFQFLPYLLSQFPLNNLCEEAFSVLECYFPVDFNPRDKVGITREDLAQGLKNCLLATPTFAQYIIPTALDKLDSQVKVAHMDSLNLLIEGMEIWSVNDLKAHTPDIWKSLSKLLLPPPDNDVGDLALKTVVSIITTLDKSNSAYQELDQLLEDISASTHGFLSDPNLSLFNPTTKLLANVSQASERSCGFIIRTILGQLLALLDQPSGRDITLTALCPILSASVKFNCWNNASNKIGELLEALPVKLISCISDPKAWNNCFSCLIEIGPHISSEQREKIINLIHGSLTHELSPIDSEMCANYVKLVGSKYPEEIKNNLLLKLNITDNCLAVKRTLDIFCWCCNVIQLTSFSIDKILLHITTGSSNIGINCLKELCENTEEKVLILLGTECKVPERLIQWTIKGIDNKEKITEETILNISKIIQAIVRSLNSSQQKTLLGNCIEEFMPSPSKNFSNLDDNQLFLLEGLICPLRQEVSIAMYDNLVTTLIDSSINKDSYRAREAACLILASIINKCQDNGDETLLDAILKPIENGKQKEMILLLSFSTKSLLMRGHNKANFFLDKLIASLSVKGIQMEAADGFKLLLLDHESLSANNYCTVKLLYKQRIFMKLNNVINLLENADDEDQIAILLAFTYIMQYVPDSLVISRLRELIPVMVRCIDCNSSTVVTTILEVIAGLLESAEPIFEEYIDTFLPRCLRCAETSNSMVVRMLALNCIYYYGLYKELTILPHKEKVLHGLISSLDDKKRLVRQKAVRARNRWFLVGGLPDR
ncbi:hypothetical protein O3M35_006701 [Rhynocoris fuscipes]|uniref:MMS19 nucleotide excision repair protein n=1 Tax=Rhynocoris fuscipes TaxID=488301 RepID=A0AAW1DGY9_9HEMI